MLPSKPNLPSAYKLFPKLRQWISPVPRRLGQVPFGHQSALEPREMSVCLRHLYHDLGVLAFEGMNTEQIRRVGNIIQRVVNAGGPGALDTSVRRANRAVKTRIDPLEEDDYFESCDIRHAGIIKPTSVIRIADTTLRNYITNTLFPAEDIDPSIHRLRDRDIRINSLLRPMRVLHHDATTSPTLTRALPLDAYTIVSFNCDLATINGQVKLYTAAGQGAYAGGCEIEYGLYRIDEEKGEMRFQNKHHKLYQLGQETPTRKEYRTRDHSRNAVVNIFNKLFKLEREVLGKKLEDWVAQHGEGRQLEEEEEVEGTDNWSRGSGK